MDGILDGALGHFGSLRAGPGRVRTDWVGPDRVGSGRVGSARSGWFGLDQIGPDWLGSGGTQSGRVGFGPVKLAWVVSGRFGSSWLDAGNHSIIWLGSVGFSQVSRWGRLGLVGLDQSGPIRIGRGPSESVVIGRGYS